MLRNKNIITGLDTEVWSGKLVDGWAVILFNRGLKQSTIEFQFTQVDYPFNRALVRDLINH